MPFEIPENWCWTTLGEVFTLQAGKNITAKEISDKQDTIYPFPCYGGNGLRGYVSSYNRTGRFPLIGRQGALCGNINVADGLFYATEHAVVVESYCNIDIDWAVYALIYLNLNQYATSTAQPGLSVATINEVLLPVPPNDEQKRIANEIEKWFDLIKEIESGKVELKSYIKQATSKILDLAITGKLVPQDPNDEPTIELLKRINPGFKPCDNSHYENIEFDIPQNWVWATIGDIFEHNTGKALNASNPNGTMLDYITTSNLYWDRFELSIIKQMPFTESEIERCIVRKGDLLICEGGDVGRAAIWDYDYNIMIQNHIHRLRGKVDICTRYFFYLFMHYKLHNLIGGKGVAIQGLSSRDLHNLIIPVPSLKEQYDIASSIDLYFSKLDMITAEL